MEDTKIIHFKIPMDKDGKLTVEFEYCYNFWKELNKILGKDYLILLTPFVTTFSENVDLENVDLDTLTLKEFLEKYNL